jgi:hypothetical protein
LVEVEEITFDRVGIDTTLSETSAKVHFAKNRTRNPYNFLEEYDVRAEQVLGAPTFADVSFRVDEIITR